MASRLIAGPVARDRALISSQHFWCVVGQGYKTPDALRASGDIGEVVAHAEIMLMVIPTPFVEKTMAGIKDKLRPDQVGWLVT